MTDELPVAQAAQPLARGTRVQLLDAIPNTEHSPRASPAPSLPGGDEAPAAAPAAAGAAAELARSTTMNPRQMAAFRPTYGEASSPLAQERAKRREAARRKERKRQRKLEEERKRKQEERAAAAADGAGHGGADGADGGGEGRQRDEPQ